MNNYGAYVIPFAEAFFSGIGILSLLVWLAKRGDFFQRKEKTHIHKGKISRLGGVALFFSFVFALFWNEQLLISQELWGVILASAALLLVGLWDDFKQLHWKTQLFFQIAIIVLAFILGVHVDYITNPWGGILFLNTGRLFFLSLLLVIFWVVLLINSINWVDGVDGLSGGITLIGAVTIFLLSLKPEVNQPPVAIVAAALVGSLLAFMVFNFYPARIFAGTSGSMFMGFILAALAIFAGAKIATTLLIAGIPIVDAMRVVLQRLSLKKSIFVGDRLHLHHKLLNFGWSQKKICAFFYGMTVLIAVAALNTRAAGKIIAAVLILVGVVGASLFIQGEQRYKTEETK